jgi:hypothetical protein
VVDADTQKAMMAWYYKKQEEQKVRRLYQQLLLLLPVALERFLASQQTPAAAIMWHLTHLWMQ